MLRGLDLRIAQETALPVHLVDAPLECVVLGAGRCLESFDRLKDMFMGRPTYLIARVALGTAASSPAPAS